MASSGPRADPLEKLAVWTARFRRSRHDLDLEEIGELEAVLGDLRIWTANGSAPRLALYEGLLDLMEAGLAPPGREPGFETFTPVFEQGREALARQFEEPDGGHLARHLAGVLRRSASEERRVAVLRLLAGRRDPPALAALLSAGRAPQARVRLEALRALSGWPDPSVHLFFLERLEHAELSFAAIRDHFETTRADLGPLALDRLRGVTGRLLVSEDWRGAIRGTQLVPLLPAELAVPLLIESLSVWRQRATTGRSSRRVESDILRELSRRSGRTLGREPKRWRAWWKAVRAGSIQLAQEADVPDELSRAVFFGLPVETDRVLFVLDRSKSMGSPFGTGGHQRFEEAIEQLAAFLEQSGPETRFNVVLFGDRGIRWRSHLVQATESNRRAVEGWLRAKRPDGATRLFEGLRAGLELARDGSPDPDEIEVDTVVLLCDGATAEGSRWVRPWLTRWNDSVQLVFHGVLIGTQGDGTLRALADATGGHFLRVQ